MVHRMTFFISGFQFPLCNDAEHLFSLCCFEVLISEFDILSVHIFIVYIESLTIFKRYSNVFTMFTRGFRKVRTPLKRSGQNTTLYWHVVSWMISSNLIEIEFGNEMFINIQSFTSLLDTMFMFFLCFAFYNDCKNKL